MLLKLLASKCDVVAMLLSPRHCVILMEEGDLRAFAFYHRACGCSAILCCCMRKETRTPNVLLQCDVMLLQEEGD